MSEKNWLEQHSLKKQWQTAYTKQLEERFEELTKLNATMDRCIAPGLITRPMSRPPRVHHRAWRAHTFLYFAPRLRTAPRRARHRTITAQRVALQELEDCLWKAGEQIVSGLNTGEPLSQASHALELASQQCWQKVIGVGYTDKQKRDLIYRHFAKAMDCVRNVTGADAIMAKQLVDLLHARVHAGEQRHVSAASLEEQREQRLCAAITGSLAEFVSGLHTARGSGRYPDKISKSMQVCAGHAFAGKRGQELTYASRAALACRPRARAGGCYCSE
jgi:hypothetical protein